MSDAATEPRALVDGGGAPAELTAPPVHTEPTGWIDRVTALRGTETAKALGLAAATMVANGLAVVFTVVFARILGTEGYGSLGALLNLSVILFVPGMAMQVAAAREGTLGRLGSGGELAATVARWTRHLLAITVTVVAVSILLREQLAALVNVDEQWAAAAVPVTAAAWLMLSVQRGVLQAGRAYKAVGISVVVEATGRLVLGVLLVVAGADVTGAYLGTPLSMLATAGVLGVVLHRRLGPAAHGAPPHPLRRLARDARFPIIGLTLVAALQNVDVIMAKHQLDDDAAGIYAAVAVAGKAVVWIAVGVGLYLLPEATRRAAAGLDPRTALVRALGVIGAVAAPALLVFGAVPSLMLRVAFGPEFEDGDTILLILGIAFGGLACTYLSVQYLLGLGWRVFVLPLAIAAAVEPFVLLGAGDLEGFAHIVLVVQIVSAAAILALSSRARAPRAGTT